jgi:Protein of unknown function (DUF4238)
MQQRQHKHQHFVNQSYLSAWTDPGTPERHEPYVWVFPREGGEGKKRAPKNIFHETDLYTIILRNGERDVRIEKSLSVIEGMFAKVREGPINGREHINDDDRAALCVFVAANLFRTKKQRDHLRGQFEKVLEIGEQMTESMRTKQKELAPKDYQKYSKLMGAMAPSNKSNTLTMEQVKALADYPLQHLMWPQIQAHSSQLFEMSLTLMTTTDGAGFITSDAPTIVRKFGLEGIPTHLRPEGFLGSRTEVMMPVSPDVMAVFHWRKGIREYVPISRKNVDESNEVACYHAAEEIVTRHNRARKSWFRGGQNSAAKARQQPRE